MATRKIIQSGDKTLTKQSREVKEFNNRLFDLIDDMKETLIEANGLGLAATQVGVLRRVAVIVNQIIDGEDIKSEMVELINPEIICADGEQTGNEGCLSFPGMYGVVSRPRDVTVRAKDRYGNDFVFSASDITARAICHEIDHLNGVVFTDIAERMLTDEELDELAAERERDSEE